MKLKNMDGKQLKKYSRVILIIAMFLPMSYPYGLTVYSTVDDVPPMSYMTYTRRPSFEQLVGVMKTQDISPSTVTLSFNTPGLEYFLQRPVLDLAIIPIQGQLKPELIKLNNTESFNFMKEFGIRYIVIPNVNNFLYDQYLDQVAFIDIFEIVEDGPNFMHIYTNYEYILFKRINSREFIVS